MADRPLILIYEPEASGHQMEYIRYILDALERSMPDARVVLLTTQNSGTHPNFLRLVDAYRHLITIRFVPDIPYQHWLFSRLGAFYRRQWRHAEQLGLGLRQNESNDIDFVLVPHMECIGLLQIALRPSLLNHKPWATIGVAIRFHHKTCGLDGPTRLLDVLQRILFRKVLSSPPLMFLASPNPYLAGYSRNRKVVYCPEPCAVPVLKSSTETRNYYGIRQDTFVVLVYGYLDRRKCIGTLLEAAVLARSRLDITVFLAGTQHAGHLAGPLASEAARTLRQQDSLVEANRFIMAGKDVDPFGAADISWVFYDTNFVLTGSVLVWSGLACRPVIARRQGVIGRLVEEHNLGIVLDSESPALVAEAILRLADAPALRQEMGQNGARVFRHHTPEDFARPIVERIQAVLRP